MSSFKLFDDRKDNYYLGNGATRCEGRSQELNGDLT
jgi:hypothetical protein